jgi:tetratricopeptide (TPR) repeat protein
MKQYEAVLALDKNNADAHYNIGRMFMEKNELDKAIAEFDLAITNNQSFTSARVDLASAYTIKKNYDKALAIYDELAKTFKSDTKYLSHIYILKGNIYQSMNDAVKAKVEYETAMKLDKNNKEAADALAK